MKGRDEKKFIEGVRRDESGSNAVFVDYDLYAHYLEDSGLPEEQKREFLQLLWSIVCEFVSLGWGVHPLQQASGAKKSRGKLPESVSDAAVSGGDAVQWLDSEFIEQFTAATGREEGRDGKDIEDGQA